MEQIAGFIYKSDLASKSFFASQYQIVYCSSKYTNYINITFRLYFLAIITNLVKAR